MNASPRLSRLPLSRGSIIHICIETSQNLIRNSGILQAHPLERAQSRLEFKRQSQGSCLLLKRMAVAQQNKAPYEAEEYSPASVMELLNAAIIILCPAVPSGRWTPQLDSTLPTSINIGQRRQMAMVPPPIPHTDRHRLMLPFHRKADTILSRELNTV